MHGGGRRRWLVAALVIAGVSAIAQAVPNAGLVGGIVSVHALICCAAITAAAGWVHRRAERRARLDAASAQVAQHEIADTMLRLITIMDTLADGVFVTNQQGRITLLNPAGARLAGLAGDVAPVTDLDGLVRCTHMRRIDGSPIPLEETPMARAGQGEAVHDVEVVVYNALLGGDRYLRVSATPLRHDNGAIAGAVAVASDISDEKETHLALRAQARTLMQLNRQLELLATRDNLTGVLNHRGFGERLDEAVARARRFTRDVALLLIDVDRFKDINDAHGHPAGDAVLVAIADRLQSGVRAVDAVGRLGGDEFAILMPETNRAGAMVLARRLQQAMRIPVPIAPGVVIPVTVSVGVATLSGESADRAGGLLQAADAALYLVKRSGRDGVHAAGEPPVRILAS